MATAIENENLNIVSTYNYKGARIFIADNYCKNTTKEEIDRIIERCNDLFTQAVAKDEYNKNKLKKDEKTA